MQHRTGMGSWPSAALDRIDEVELFARARLEADQRAREELVRRHMPLARRIALRYAHSPEPFDDLFQVASLGLVKAIDRFDPGRGFRFTSFAVPTILGELKRHFRDKGRPIHLPRGLQELVLKVQAAETRLEARTGKSPTVIEVAEHLDVGLEYVVEALDAIASQHSVSIDAPVDCDLDDGLSTRHELIGAPDESYALVDSSLSLNAAVTQLTEHEQMVFRLRFEDELTQREIAGRLGISQMGVSRSLRRITDQLRELMGVSPAPLPTPRPRRIAANASR